MRCWNQVVLWSPTRELASAFPAPLEMRVFFIHPLGTNLHPLRKGLHWVNSSINQQSNSSINSKFIGIWSFTIIPIMFYLELLKPWTQDVHKIVLQIWKVFVMACSHSIFAFKDYFKSFVWLLEVVGQKPCIRSISRRLIFHLLCSLWIMHENDYPMMPNLHEYGWGATIQWIVGCVIRRPLLPTALLDFIEDFFGHLCW
jgi:hypothetical protein